MELDYAAAEQAGWFDEASGSRGQHISVPEKEVSLIKYAPALLVALFKDMLDLIIGWIPVIGFVFAMGLGFLIFMLLLMAKANRRLVESRFLIKTLLKLIIAALIESIPLLNLLPVETLVVYFIYHTDKKFEDRQIAAFVSALQKSFWKDSSKKAIFEA